MSEERSSGPSMVSVLENACWWMWLQSGASEFAISLGRSAHEGFASCFSGTITPEDPINWHFRVGHALVLRDDDAPPYQVLVCPQEADVDRYLEERENVRSA